MHDLGLAIVHHLLVFALAGILAMEVALVRPGMNTDALMRVAKVDLWYGVLAGLIVVVGFGRAVFAAKGWGYYSHNLFFWAKIAAFVVVGLLSVPPTIRYLGWARALKADPTALPDPAAIGAVQRLLWIEVGVFALIPAFAAAMARGYGQF